MVVVEARVVYKREVRILRECFLVYRSMFLSPWVADPENHEEVEDLSYVTIKDSQHRLEEGNLYCVVHFTGSDVFIFT